MWACMMARKPPLRNSIVQGALEVSDSILNDLIGSKAGMKHTTAPIYDKPDSYNDPLISLQNFEPNFYDLLLLDIRNAQYEWLRTIR
jgi:hypothetical protein